MSEILPPLDTSAALTKKEEIDTLLAAINIHETRLSRSYARLGSALNEVKVQQFWISYGFDKFSSYLESVWTAIGKKRSQVYGILSVSETLLPVLTESQLEDIGITKAYELQRLVKQGGTVQARIFNPTVQDLEHPTDIRIMDYAADPKVTAAQLRVKVNELLHVHEGPQGLWFDLGGFYATDDERKEIAQFWEWGKTALEITSDSEHEVKKQVFMAAVRECLGSWAEVANAV